MKRAIVTAACMGMAMAAVPGRAAEASFERTLTMSGSVELNVSTGAGTIHLTAGPDGRVHILGHVKSNWSGNDDKVRDLADHPPIEQTGSIVRVGAHMGPLHNISIDYEIEAPAGAFLDAGAGSGDVNDDGVGINAKLHTGSGKIHATGLRGSFTVETGSGSIYAEQAGDGDVKAQTGSGTIELRNLHGALRASTGSGGIKAAGSPAGPWRLHTGSGSVELWTGNTGLTLDANTGSGGIHSDREIATQGTLGKHHVTGKIGGGGPEVHIETGSGTIRIH
jgi:hypothetical protein